MSIRDELTDALREMIAEIPCSIRIGNDTFTGLRRDMTFNETNVPGGTGESGGYVVTIPKADMAEKPNQGEEIEADGVVLTILGVTERNGVSYEITAGDVTPEDS